MSGVRYVAAVHAMTRAGDQDVVERDWDPLSGVWLQCACYYCKLAVFPSLALICCVRFSSVWRLALIRSCFSLHPFADNSTLSRREISLTRSKVHCLVTCFESPHCRSRRSLVPPPSTKLRSTSTALSALLLFWRSHAILGSRHAVRCSLAIPPVAWKESTTTYLHIQAIVSASVSPTVHPITAFDNDQPVFTPQLSKSKF